MESKITFEAVGARVYVVVGGSKELFCVMSEKLLTPKGAADETAQALNSHMSR